MLKYIKCKKNSKMFEDIVYISSIIVGITLGNYYKNIDNIEVKKHYGTGVGILMAFFICGHYLYHTILMVWMNIVIYKCCEKRYVHLASLGYTWTHLTYLHFYLYKATYVIMLHQSIALRLVGIAFELYSADKNRSTSSQSLKINSGDFELLVEINTTDVISYAFCFIGLQNGPYFKYKHFLDYLKGNFGSMGNFRQITEHKLKKVFLCILGYLLMRMKYSPQIYYNKEFYTYDSDTRYLYNVPILMMFALKNFILMLLCTCVCIEAGFGVYPAKTAPLPGYGPTTKFSLMHLSEDKAMQEEYNFSMIKCFDNEKLLIGPKMIDTVRSWNMPTRYWFWANIYQNVSGTTEIRSACSYVVWMVWYSASLRSLIISTTLWVYIRVEAEYSKLYHTMGQMKIAWDIGFSIMRSFCLIYLTPCFVLNDASTILKYYLSIFWVFHVLLLVLIAGAIVSHKSRYYTVNM